MKKNLPLFATLLVTLILDLITKNWAATQLIISPIKLTSFFQLTYHENPGIAFGLPLGGWPLLLITGVLILAFMVYAPRAFNMERLSVKLALGLVFGGAIGNFYDRFTLGIVRDFIALDFWPAFNLADTAIVIGVFILLIHLPRD